MTMLGVKTNYIALPEIKIKSQIRLMCCLGQCLKNNNNIDDVPLNIGGGDFIYERRKDIGNPLDDIQWSIKWAPIECSYGNKSLASVRGQPHHLH